MLPYLENFRDFLVNFWENWMKIQYVEETAVGEIRDVIFFFKYRKMVLFQNWTNTTGTNNFGKVPYGFSSNYWSKFGEKITGVGLESGTEDAEADLAVIFHNIKISWILTHYFPKNKILKVYQNLWLHYVIFWERQTLEAPSSTPGEDRDTHPLSYLQEI